MMLYADDTQIFATGTAEVLANYINSDLESYHISLFTLGFLE